MNDLFVIGVNHQTASVAVRELFADNDGSANALRRQLVECVDELVLLCTCNRTEVIYVASERKDHEQLRERLRQHGELDPSTFDTLFYSYAGREAMTHLCRVAAGLDSMVVGETQILGQFKAAFEEAFQTGVAGDHLQRLYQHVLNAAKAVRTETAVGEGRASVGSVAVKLAENIFSTLNDRKVLIIGAGDMAELTAEHFGRHNVLAINVVNRSHEAATTLASRFGGRGFSFVDLSTNLMTADICVCSTGSPVPVITHELVRPIASRRRHPLFIIDIAVPRDVDPLVQQFDNIYLYTLDDIQVLVNENIDARRLEAAKAEELVTEKIDTISQASSPAIGPLITSLHDRATTIKAAELEKLYRRHPEWSDEEREQVERSINRVVNRVLHAPITSLRRELGEGNRSERSIIEVFKDLFNLN